MPPFQFAAAAYQARSTQLLAQQCINAFVETTPKDAKTPVPIYGTPGLSVFIRAGNGPINGAWVMAGNLYFLSGGALYEVLASSVMTNPDGSVSASATLIGQTTIGGIASLADNGLQLVMVDGSAGWIYQPGGLNLVTTATDSPANVVTATVQGTTTNGDVVSLVATAAQISGSPVTVQATSSPSSNTATIAQALAAAINGNGSFSAAGVSALVNGSTIALSGPATYSIAWTSSTSGAATEYVTFGSAVVQGATQVAANITGTVTAGDTLLIPLDSGATFTTTATQTVGPSSGILYWADPLPSQVSAGAAIIDPGNYLAQIEAPAFMPANVVTYMDGYFVFNASGTRQFFLSGINDGTQYSGLDFATATANTGDVLTVVNFHEQLLIMTNKPSIEVWYDSGASAFPFQRYDGAYIQRGIAASLAFCSEDNTVFWMGDDGIVYRLNGFLPQRISTFAMEHAWAQYPQRYLDCFMFVLDQEGHKFVVCQFPSGNQTWVYDISTQLWHQRESWGTPWV
jgi:hypothetical protein